MKLRVTPLSGLKSRILIEVLSSSGVSNDPVMCPWSISHGRRSLVERLAVLSSRAVILKCSSRSHADTIIVGRIVHRAKPEQGKPELSLIQTAQVFSTRVYPAGDYTDSVRRRSTPTNLARHIFRELFNTGRKRISSWAYYLRRKPKSGESLGAIDSRPAPRSNRSAKATARVLPL
jgi:hypothetical protein